MPHLQLQQTEHRHESARKESQHQPLEMKEDQHKFLEMEMVMETDSSLHDDKGVLLSGIMTVAYSQPKTS